LFSSPPRRYLLVTGYKVYSIYRMCLWSKSSFM
jgi:hypothetical protein